MITIHDVAAACGVSATTVSHVLNHTRPVDPQTAARVRAAVETLGYRPLRNRDKYGLRASRTVGFLPTALESLPAPTCLNACAARWVHNAV